MIVVDGKNVYGINRYQLNRKNGNNEIRYLVKYGNCLKRGFVSSLEAFIYLEALKSGKISVPDKTMQLSLDDLGKEYTISEATEKFLTLYKDQVRYGTYDKCCYYFRKIIVPNLPDIPVKQLTNIHVLEFRSKLNSEITKVSENGKNSKTYATKTKNDILSLFKMFLSFAIDNFGVNRNVTKNVKKFKKTHEEKKKEKEKEEQMWSVDEYYSFLDALERLYGKYSPTYGIYLVIGNKGLRLGECLALKFNDLKYENMLIVDESITRKTEKALFETGDPKNESSDRKIVIGKGLYNYLMTVKEREQRHPDYDDEWFVFHRNRNVYLPMAERTLNNHKQAALDLIGLRWNTNHQLRHLYNTYLKDQGIPVYDRSTTLGQKDAEVNSEIYTHLSPESIRKISETDDKLFNRNK